MAISGTSCSTCSSTALTAYGSNQLRQDEKENHLDLNLNEEKKSNKEPAEYIFRGELLDEITENNGFRTKKDQTIDPANQTAINNYEDNSAPTDSIFFQQQGAILDAYA